MNYIKRLGLLFVLLLTVVAVYAGGIKNAQELMAFVTAINDKEEINYGDWAKYNNVILSPEDVEAVKKLSVIL